MVVSFAIAAPPPGHGHQSGSTSTGEEHGKSGDKSNVKCHPLNLKGKLTAGTLSLSVAKASGNNAKNLAGTTASLTVSGTVSVQAWSCGATGPTGAAAGAPTLYLKQLHVGGSPHNF